MVAVCVHGFERMYMREAELNQNRRDANMFHCEHHGLTWRINDAYVKGGRTSVFM